MENEINQTISFIQGIRKIWWIVAAIFLWMASIGAIAFFTFRYAKNLEAARESQAKIETINRTNLIIKEQIRFVEITNIVIERKLVENEKSIANCSNILLCSNLADSIREYHK